MAQFYCPDINPIDNSYTLNEEESKHACRVLRMKINDSLELLDGKGFSYLAKITEDHPKKCQVRILEVHKAEQEQQIHLAIAPTKNIDRIEWLIEKVTEIGVTEISLLLCSNSERKLVKTDRLEKILIAAMKQSKRYFLPKLNELITFNEFVKAHPQGYIAHCYDQPKSSLNETKYQSSLPILIGPEGDFSIEEVNLALDSGYKGISLGNNRLRTETAGLVASVEARNNIIA